MKLPLAIACLALAGCTPADNAKVDRAVIAGQLFCSKVTPLGPITVALADAAGAPISVIGRTSQAVAALCAATDAIPVAPPPAPAQAPVVPVANLPYTMSSDAGHLMTAGEPFAACYVDTPNGRTFSLRSTDEGVDVSAVAQSFGGGGHRNAAGFSAPIGWEGDATSGPG